MHTDEPADPEDFFNGINFERLMRMKSKIAIVCSEFHKDWVKTLYDQAYDELEKYRNKVKRFSSRSEGKNPPRVLDFIEGSFKHRKLKNKTPRQVNLFFKSIMDIIQGDIEPLWVPGAGELPQGVKWALDYKKVEALLALGVVIKGQTPHFDFLRGFLEKALWDLQKTYELPIVFSILMAENKQQVLDRIQGAEHLKKASQPVTQYARAGMKTLIQMIELHHILKIH